MFLAPHIVRSAYAITIFCAIFFSSLSAATNIPIQEEQAMQEHFSHLAHKPGAVVFTPPVGWFLADPKALPNNVKIMVVGKGAPGYPPSINLSTEKFSGGLKQYLKIVKNINEKNGDEWKDLGTIRTEAGNASLSQVDIQSKWGTERLMHVILEKNGMIYILTAAAMKSEFPKYYKDFFSSLRSLRINPDSIELVKDNTRRTALEKTIHDLKQDWIVYYQKYKQTAQNIPADQLSERAFNSENFQKPYWESFKSLLVKNYADMGIEWQTQLLKKTQEDLFN
jgi:hypothetical protein